MRRDALSENCDTYGGNCELLSGVLDVAAFAELFGTTCEDIVSRCGELIDSFDFHYDVVTGEEQDAVILTVLKAIDSGKFKVSGKERKKDWEKGWQENLDAYVDSGHDMAALAPKYISKYDVLRLFSRFVRPRDKQFELNYYKVYRQFLFSTYFVPYRNIFEFGCGTGYNLAMMNRMFPDKRIVGLDWAESSVKIADMLGTELNAPISGRHFDFFNPDYNLDFPAESVVITLNSLEQIGGDHTAFLEFLLAKKPTLCINAEPALEMYSEDNLVDYLATRYHRARHYLVGYFDALKRLEGEGRIRIEKAKRVPIGNYFHEGYSFIVWHVIA
jgi:SAM-dependent methyltransferase